MMLLLSYFFAYHPYDGIIWIWHKQKSAICSVKGKQIDARAKYDKQIIVLPTIRFRSPPARRGIRNQTESHAARIAILPTRTMDADRIRALIPTFSWGTPQWRPFGHMTREQALSYASPRITLDLAHPYGSGRAAAHTPNAHSLPLSSQAQSNRPRPVITHPQQTKTNDMKL